MHGQMYLKGMKEGIQRGIEKGIEKGRQTKKEYYGQTEKQIKEKHYFEDW